MNTKSNRGKPRILMIGPGRKVKGGISTVVNSYYKIGLDKEFDLKYISTMIDGSKILKLFVAFFSYIYFCLVLNNYDVVHIHMAAQASFYRKACFIKMAKRAHKKIIIHQHAGNFDSFYLEECNNNKKQSIKEIFSYADKVIVLSEEWKYFFSQYICDESKVVIINNGVVLPNYKKDDYDNKNILYIGRITREKGVFELINAIEKVSNRYKEVVLYIAGDGEDYEICRRVVTKLGISKNVKFLGWIDNIDDYMKKCSVFILPSHFECMPMSLLEAMSYSLVPVATDVGGIPRIIENSLDGYIIEPCNEERIESILIKVLSNVKEKERVGVNARAKVEDKFNIIQNIEILKKLYDSF